MHFPANPESTLNARPSKSYTSHPLLAPLIDAHIHLDSYENEPLEFMLNELPQTEVECVIAVSMHLDSSRANLQLSRDYPALVQPAFGFHPEQPLPTEAEIDQLFEWMEAHLSDMIAVGEVGLPYYSRLEATEVGQIFEDAPYIRLLERFISFAAKHNKPIVLHAVYEDADIAYELLQKHGVTRAHFHWFKGSKATIELMAKRGYYVSFTPDITYETEIQELARLYPVTQVMAETDGPWPFEGPFAGQMTHPRMTAAVVETWSRIHNIPLPEARQIIHANTKFFYGI